MLKCKCGSTIRSSSKWAHETSLKHIKWYDQRDPSWYNQWVANWPVDYDYIELTGYRRRLIVLDLDD